jgi:ATP-dependent Lhr-like helicase
MDFPGLKRILERMEAGEFTLVARDTTEPSPLCHEVINARPYAFLDDAPLEERRAHAVQSRRTGEPANGGDLGRLDQAAIDRVREEVTPRPRDADELHDALLSCGFLTSGEMESMPIGLFDELVSKQRAGVATIAEGIAVTVSAERIPELLAIVPSAALEPCIVPPASRSSRAWTPAEALVEILRGRLTIAGPITAVELARTLAIPERQVDAALLTLEADGVVLRGRFSPRASSHEPRAFNGATLPDPGSRPSTGSGRPELVEGRIPASVRPRPGRRGAHPACPRPGDYRPEHGRKDCRVEDGRAAFADGAGRAADSRRRWFADSGLRLSIR